MAVTASVVLRYDPSRRDNRESDRDSTWAGSVTLAEPSVDVDLFDAAPRILRMPDGRESEFMATSGGRTEVGLAGLGPAPFVESWSHPFDVHSV
ncbi:hypothetical protein [Streptomyces sp. NPDC001833]|uniref:hypothetical protein n=1 Tax=Streptomyces sp. NPDC001833 TaxID=3154658 RepID=UPI00331A1385